MTKHDSAAEPVKETQMTQTSSATPTGRTVRSLEELAALDSNAQSAYCTSIVGSDVEEGEVEGLLYLAEHGKEPHTPMWAVFALGRARPFAAAVLPKLVELLSRETNPGRFRGNLAETIGKLPGAVEHISILFENYSDVRLETEYRGLVGCAIARIFSDPTTTIEEPVATRFIGSPLGEETPACAVLRHLIDRPVHDSVVEAALKALLNHPTKHFLSARPAIEQAAHSRHSEAIKAAGMLALARF